MSTDGRFQTMNRLKKTTLRLATSERPGSGAEPETTSAEPRVVPFRTLDVGEEPITVVYKRRAEPQLETSTPDIEPEVPLFEGTLVLSPAPAIGGSDPAQAPRPTEREPVIAVPALTQSNAGATLVISTPMQDGTVVMSQPAAAFETTVVAPRAAASLGTPVSERSFAEQTRIAPIEGWRPPNQEPKAVFAPSTNQKAPSPPLAVSAARQTRLSNIWRALTPINRASVLLAPFALASVVAMLWPDHRSPSGEHLATPAQSEKEPAKLDKPKSAPTPTAAVTQGVAAPPKLPNGKTLQRAAADAISEGNHAAALNLYRQLATNEPDVAAYRAAVRILEERTRTE